MEEVHRGVLQGDPRQPLIEVLRGVDLLPQDLCSNLCRTEVLARHKNDLPSVQLCQIPVLVFSHPEGSVPPQRKTLGYSPPKGVAP